MKIIAICIFLFSIFAKADTTPNCWTDENKNLIDGEFLVLIDYKNFNKEGLIEVLSSLKSQNLEPKSFPLIFSNQQSMLITLKATDSTKKLNRDELKTKVSSQLQEVLKLPSLKVQCNTLVKPANH